MNLNFTQLATALQSLTTDTQHAEYAKQHILIAGSNILLLLTHYEELKKIRPSTYLEDMMSGKMAELFEKAASSDPKTAKNIIILSKLTPQLKTLTKAIQYKNMHSQLTEEDCEATAMLMLRNIMTVAPTIAAIKKEAVKETKKLLSEKEDDSLAKTTLDQILQSNYMDEQ